jgi:peptide/nickel transport system ATP-binding protein
VLNLLQDLKARLALTFIFISHDLSVVHFISDRVMVMYLGKVVEIGPVDSIYQRPRHPYTKALLSSRPSMNPKQRRTEPPLTGDPPSLIDPPSGCRFRTRCALAEAICAAVEPQLAEQGDGHFAACLATTPGSGHSAVAA